MSDCITQATMYTIVYIYAYFQVLNKCKFQLKFISASQNMKKRHLLRNKVNGVRIPFNIHAITKAKTTYVAIRRLTKQSRLNLVFNIIQCTYLLTKLQWY